MGCPLTTINQWLADYEDGNPIDYLIAMVIESVIGVVGSSVEMDIMKKADNNETTYTGRYASQVAAMAMRNIADTMDRELSRFDKMN